MDAPMCLVSVDEDSGKYVLQPEAARALAEIRGASRRPEPPALEPALQPPAPC